MLSFWKCPVCLHANKGGDGDPCYFCGSHERRALHPVKVPNRQQGTPNYETLTYELARYEANRGTDQPEVDQFKALIDAYFQEVADRQINKSVDNPPAGQSAEERPDVRDHRSECPPEYPFGR